MQGFQRLAWEGDGPPLQAHERVGGPQDGQPLLIIAKLLWALGFWKLQHLQPSSAFNFPNQTQIMAAPGACAFLEVGLLCVSRT